MPRGLRFIVLLGPCLVWLGACGGGDTPTPSAASTGEGATSFTCFPEPCHTGPESADGGRSSVGECGPEGCGISEPPECPDGRCPKRCGDGIKLAEECDDGNLRDGDGCSSRCTVEPGFECSDGNSCQELCDLRVSVTYRDFRMHQPQDFQVGCGELVTGIVQDTLDEDDKPVLRNGDRACIESAETFAQWYRDGPNNRTIPGVLTLYLNDEGAYVNRFGPGGEPWVDPEGNAYDGNPLFFPLDDVPDAFDDPQFPAKIPEQYGYNGWPWENTLDPSAAEPTHNFSFTTEVVSWFLYDETKSPTLEFTGDDDVWVFINRRLAVDLGGVHVPETASVTLDPPTAAHLGLESGRLYPLHVFHAERKMEGSSFKLTITDFELQRSQCTGICGDGILVEGEYCDDGNQVNGDGCNSDCSVPVL